MFFKKTGLPEEGDIVLCTVKKILYHSIFVVLDEYENQEAMIHISEIAPGRIRNIRDYVVEGKKLVCKVLRINRERGHVDLSLRRVSLGARKRKNEEHKQETKAEKMLDILATKLKEKKEDVFKKIGLKVLEEYDTLFHCFQEVAIRGEEVLKELELPAKYSQALAEIIQERIKPPEVYVEGTLVLTSNSDKGVEDIKKAILDGEAVAKGADYSVNVSYLGAPNYKITVIASEYKEAEEGLEKVTKKIIGTLEKLGGKGEFKKK